MAKPNRLEAYPQAFFDVLDQLQEDPARVLVLKCKDEKEAKDFRLMFYGFRKAYLEAEMHRKSGGYLDIEGLTLAVRPTIDVRTEQAIAWELKISHRDYSPLALRLKEAVAAAKIERDDPANGSISPDCIRVRPTDE